MLNDVSIAPIDDFENEQRNSKVTLFECKDRFPNGPLHRSIRGMDPTKKIPCPPRDLLTVFSTAQLEHSITQCDSCHHGFGSVHYWNDPTWRIVVKYEGIEEY